MQTKFSLALCTASLFIAFPLTAQRQDGNHGHHGHHGHHGNNSNHSGHDDNGSGGHHDDGDDDGQGGEQNHGHGNDNLVLNTPAITASVASEVTSVTTALKGGSLLTPAGNALPAEAQTRAYAVLSADPAMSFSATELSTALSTAGPAASATLPDLVRSFSGLSTHPAQLPSAIEEYNRFTRAASNEFIANPPPEFIALHSVLTRLTTAAASTK